MKWTEAYRCKVCGKIYKYKDTRLCRRCGTQLTYREEISPYMRMFDRPNCPVIPNTHATENLEPMIVRRVFFGYEQRPSAIPEWVIKGEPPPRPNPETTPQSNEAKGDE